MAVVACGGSATPPPPPLSNTAPADATAPLDDASAELETAVHTRPEQIARMAQFRDLICRCPDPSCGERVTDALERWGHAMADADDIPTTIPPPTREEAQQMRDLGHEIQACATAVTARPQP